VSGSSGSSSASSRITVKNLLCVAFLEEGGAKMTEVRPPGAGERFCEIVLDTAPMRRDALAQKFEDLAAAVRACNDPSELQRIFDSSVLRKMDRKLEQRKRLTVEVKRGLSGEARR